MEQATKVRKPRVVKPALPHVVAAKKAFSNALKAEVQLRLLRDKHVDAIASIDARLAALEGNVSMAWQSVATTATAASAVQRG